MKVLLANLSILFFMFKKCTIFMDILDGTIGVNQKYIFEPA